MCEKISSVSASLKYGIVCHQVLLTLNHYHHLEIHSIILICVYDVLNAFIVLLCT